MAAGASGEAVRRAVDARGVARVEIARERVRNALDEATIEELAGAFAALARDPAVRVLVVTGRGPAFCAGADLRWMRRSAGMSVEENVRDSEQFASMLEALAEFPCPTIAQVQGAAYGGGLGLVAAADIAVAAASARFALSEVRLGLEPAMIAPYVAGAIGPREFRQRALTGSPFGADEALRLGLVSQVTDDEGLAAAVDALVTELLKGGPEAQRHIKDLIRSIAGRVGDGALRTELATRISMRRAGREGQEGAAAFLERRAPDWMA